MGSLGTEGPQRGWGTAMLVAGGTARAARNASPGGRVGRSAERGTVGGFKRGDKQEGKEQVPGLRASLCQTWLPPRVGLGQGLVPGKLFLQGGASSRDTPGPRVSCFLPIPALCIPVQASPSPLLCHLTTQSLYLRAQPLPSLHTSVLTPSFRRLLSHPATLG